MKRFSFSLQKLLDLRTFREKEAEIALGKAVSNRDSIQLELEDVAKKRVAAAWERRANTDIHTLVAIENYVLRLDTRKDALLEQLAAAELVVEQKRELYMAATRDRQVITKLREKKESVWHKEYLDSEADALDDLVNSRRRSEEL
jgi:flagellar protein FliJ